MPADISMTAILLVFYLVFLGQIFVISIYYPNKMMNRVRYVHDTYPPEEFPRLYPGKSAAETSKNLVSRHRVIAVYCVAVAVLGIGILGYMLGSGYRPAMEGGDEIFVMLYFFLQAAPFIYLAVKEYQQFGDMKAAYRSKVRTAGLRPRRLFDFVQPAHFTAAVIMFVIWLAFYIWQAGDVSGWGSEVYATLLMIPGMNVAYGIIIARHIGGKKQDPYQSRDDQLRAIGVTVRILVTSSFMISLFMLLTQLADAFAFEVFDPVLASFYLQLCLVMGVGQTLRTVKVEDIDFDVYRADQPAG